MPLRYLFIDMNAYFASVEQHDHPAWRGKPVAVVPVQARTSSCIAASYPAKRLGIRTGTPVWEAQQRCPGLILALARPERYVEIHKEILRAVSKCIPITKVMSIDEMACKLVGSERNEASVVRISAAIKAELRRRLSDALTCSIGAGPNVMLAKVAGDQLKPDGLTIFKCEGLADRLAQLALTDFPGIGPRMEKRFHRYGITTAKQLLDLNERSLAVVWGSKVHAARWYHLLRGEDVPDAPTRRRTVGHSHVLAPNLRDRAGSRGVMVRLIHKACARLRALEHWAGAMAVGFQTLGGVKWKAEVKLPHCQDTLSWLLAFAELWESAPDPREAGPVLQVWMVLTDLVPAGAATPSLFDRDRQGTKLAHAMDAINRKFGAHAIRFGGIVGAEHSAPTRIPFNHIPKFNPASM